MSDLQTLVAQEGAKQLATFTTDVTVKKVLNYLKSSGGGRLPLGHLFAWPFQTPPDGAIQCNGAEYNRALYADFFAHASSKGWVKTESEWQQIASANGGFCPWYSDGDGSTTFRTPKFAPFMQVAIASRNVGKYHQAGLPDITGSISVSGGESDLSRTTGTLVSSGALTASSLCTTRLAGYVECNGRHWSTRSFSANDSDKTYARSSTVQPESSEWMICVVVFGVATNIGSTDVGNVMSAVAQVQAEIESIRKIIENITKFAAPDYASEVTIAANTPTTIQSNGFLRYRIVHTGTGGKERKITINGVELQVSADNWSTDRGILPVLKGDIVSHNGVDNLVFYPARYGV